MILFKVFITCAIVLICGIGGNTLSVGYREKYIGPFAAFSVGVLYGLMVCSGLIYIWIS